MNNKLDTHVGAYKGANQYDFDNEILLNWYPKRVIELVDSTDSILELGIGHGFTSKIFSEKFSNHTVLEGSEAVINNFKQRFPNLQTDIVLTYFENFETDKKFDVIIMGFILEHVDEPSRIISQFKKFLKPSGKLYVAVPNAETLNRRVGNIAGLLPDVELLSDYDHLLGHKRYYTLASLTSEVEAAGYKINKIEGIYLKPLTTSQMVSLELSPQVIDAFCKVGIDYPELSCGILAELQVAK